MANYRQVSYGSKGEEVRLLQEGLNRFGNYNLDTDGIFGDKTKAAVTDFQKKNNLTVDGIAGENTWSALASSPAPAAAPADTGSTAAATPAQPEATTPSFSYGDYAPSETVAQAEALLQQQMAQKPGQYQSTWAGQLNDTIQQILNQEKFSYDVNQDALYQQYADQYTRQGKLASMDTMGQAAALTGGYGSSYGQSVGQQAYQAYLQQLNEVVPELYGMALDQHNQERQQLYDQAALMAQMEDQEYGRYMDSMNAYLTERDYLTGRFDTERDYDYGKWADGRDFGYGQFIDDRNMGYQKERDQVADQQWQKEYDFAMQQYLDSQKASSSGSSSGNPGSYDGGSDYTANPGWDTETIKAFQQAHGLTVDGIWGPKTAAAYDSDPDWTGGPGTGNDDYYDQLLGAVSTAKGAYSKQDYATRQQTYQETVAAINDAYNNGMITADQKQSLLRIATPSTR